MTPPLAKGPDRHRAHHTKVAASLGRLVVSLSPALSPALAKALANALLLSLAACGGSSLPRPPVGPAHVEDYVEVPFPPRPPPAEIVPRAPSAEAVWVDGTWEWSGQRYRWTPGAWVLAPAGAVHTPWLVVRRAQDGQLFFARSAWRTRSGQVLEEPEALVRARSRPTED